MTREDIIKLPKVELHCHLDGSLSQEFVEKRLGRQVGKEELRKHLVEEMADVLMYYNDVMLCYGITAEELKAAYTEKFEKNMKRW